MPKNPVTDPITDQEIAFAHLVLAGTMTDRRAAEAVGLNPDTAAYAKAKPRVQAYMHQHRETMNNLRVQQESGELQRRNLCREQVLNRLWELAALSHEVTRNSASVQIKALSMIIAMEGLIPDRRAAAKEKATPTPFDMFQAESLLEQNQQNGIHPSPDASPDEENPGVSPLRASADAPADPDPTSASDVDYSQIIDTRPSYIAPSGSSPMDVYAPGTRNRFIMKGLSFGRRK